MEDLKFLDNVIRSFEQRYQNSRNDAERDFALITKYALERIKLFCLKKGYDEGVHPEGG